MRQTTNKLKSVVLFLCVAVLAGGGVQAEGEAGRTWDEMMRLLSQARAAQGAARYDEAIALYEHALEIVRELDEPQAEGVILNNLGLCYHAIAEFTRAIGYHQQALEIRHAFDDGSGKADSLNNLGISYRALGDYAGAIGYHQQALAIRRAINDPAAVAASLKNLGVCHQYLGNYARAMDLFLQSLNIFVGLRDRAGVARSLGNLGVSYRALGDHARAIDYHEQSLSIFVGLRDHTGVASSLNNLGVCYDFLGDYPRAIELYEQSLAIKRAIGDDPGVARSLNNLGISYHALSDYGHAIDYHEESLAIRRAIGDRSGVAASLNNIGLCYHSLGDYTRAIDYLEQALSVEPGAGEGKCNAHWGLGRTHRALEQPHTAAFHYEAALEILESIRGNVQEEELRQTFLEGLRSLYEEYLELLLEMGRQDETLLVAERLRARTFLDALYQSGLKPEELNLDDPGLAPRAVAQLPVLAVDALNEAVLEAQRSLLPTEAALQYMAGDRGIYLWVVTRGTVHGPEFIHYERAQLLRDVLALRRAAEVQVEEGPDGQARLVFGDPSALLGAFYEALVQPALAHVSASVDTLILLPSGPLWYIPFGALLMTDRVPTSFDGSDGAPQRRPTYLVERYTLAYLPSLASLPMLTRREEPSTGEFFALANPTLTEEQQELVGTHYQHGVLETAAQAFAQTVGGDEDSVHVQRAAHEGLAHTDVSGQRVLLFACHGLFNPRLPFQSRLLLAPATDGESPTEASRDRRRPDGYYHAFEALLTDHSGVELVVLAACETLLPTLREVQGALGMTLGAESDERLSAEQLELIVAGDEVVGLARAFLSSGAGSVLGTLWQASPRAVGTLLETLARHRSEQASWAQALRQAQIELISTQDSLVDLSHPWFWAPFQLIGRWR